MNLQTETNLIMRFIALNTKYVIIKKNDRLAQNYYTLYDINATRK